MIAFAICAFSLSAAAAENAQREIDSYLAGPNRADPQPGDPKESLIIEIEGDRAKEIFDAMPGPSRKLECGQPDEDGVPTKTAGKLECSIDHDGKYRCSVGIELNTGKPVIGYIC